MSCNDGLMTAIACLKIFIGTNVRASQQEALAGLVAKVAGAFLESRWKWPRRWGEVAPFTFVIADPRTSRLDAHEVTSLTEELHFKLFGQGGEGDIKMLMFEGEADAVMRFASTETAELERYLNDAGPVGGFDGRLLRITQDGVYTLAPASELGHLPPPTASAGQPSAAATPAPASRPATATAPAAPAAAPRPAAKVRDPEFIASFRGVYATRNQTFVGGVVQAARQNSALTPSVVDGPSEMPPEEFVAAFDEAGINAAVTALAYLKHPGVVFVPIAYEALIHRGERQVRETWLSRLHPDDRPRLAATVYATPRDPPYAAIVQIQTILRPYFGYIDLQTADPDFQIDKLAKEAVNSVTLGLPDAEPGVRMAAAQRFIANGEAYRRRRIWPGLTNVRTAREVDALLAAGMPFLSGPAIGEPVDEPVLAAAWPKTQLPMVGEPDLKRRRFAGPGGL